MESFSCITQNELLLYCRDTRGRARGKKKEKKKKRKIPDRNLYRKLCLVKTEIRKRDPQSPPYHIASRWCHTMQPALLATMWDMCVYTYDVVQIIISMVCASVFILQNSKGLLKDHKYMLFIM